LGTLEEVEMQLAVGAAREKSLLAAEDVPLDAQHLVGVAAEREERQRGARVPDADGVVEGGRGKLDVVVGVPLDVRDDALV